MTTTMTAADRRSRTVKTRTLIIIVALAAALTATTGALVAPAVADAPSQDTFEVSFNDIDPCTGELHTLTFTIVLSQHHHGDRFVEQGQTEITTTPTGYVGRGTHTLQDNGETFVFRFADMLANDAGDRIRARAVVVVDQSTGEVRVEKSAFTCVGT